METAFLSASGGIQRLATCGIPVIDGPTGSMANNGAVTLGTALPTTYANCYLALPANAISAGSAAGTYFAQMSSTTVGTVFNNLLVGAPTIPASPTAFVTTGPGAYTGLTTAVALVTIPVPAAAMGLNGGLRITHYWAVNNTAGAKGLLVSYGGTAFYSVTGASLAALYNQHSIFNRGVANAQIGSPIVATGFGTGTGGAGTLAYGSVNSAVAQNLVLQATLATATDLAVLEGFDLELIPG